MGSTLELLPARLSRHPRLFIAVTTATILVLIPTLRISLLSRRLSRQITYHQTLLGREARRLLSGTPETEQDVDGDQPDRTPGSAPTRSIPAPYPTFMESLPLSLTTEPSLYNIFYDISILGIPASTIPATLTANPEDLLITYMQHTMTLFSRTPQAWIMWLAAGNTKERRSFDKEWIESLGFEIDDLVNGMYTVVEKGGIGYGSHGAKVVLEMRKGEVEGRLVISARQEQNKGKGQQNEGSTEEHMVFGAETWMWVKKEAGVTMPMEMSGPRLMHRLGSWWLLVSGTGYLQKLGR